MSAAPDRSEIGPYPRGCLGLGRARRSVPTGEVFGAGTQVSPQTDQTQASSGGRAISPKAPMSAAPDRSEIGPYPRGCLGLGRAWRSAPTGEVFGPGTQVSPQTGQTQASSGGRAISPKAPMSAVRTARRSVPTPEAVWVWDALGDWSLPGRSSGDIPGLGHWLGILREVGR